MKIINRWSNHVDSPDNNPMYVGDPSDEIWVTKDKIKIRIRDMTDEHVINCFHMVSKTLDWHWREIFELEMEKRGLFTYEYAD